ncbi:MULE transposase domain [Phytophthora cactorum]|nr:MULE transposase domain [Phytophthora cactorum]
MTGPAPKALKRKNPKDSMAPLIALCDGRLYDQQDPATLLDTEMVILSQFPSRDTGLVSHLGDGSTSYPLRYPQHGYQRVVVFTFVIRISVDTTIRWCYFCTSQKRAIDIGWCIQYIQRVCMDVSGVPFSPEFVMMDADKAQFNACVTELPHTTVLMCWFHVTKNVWKHSQEKKFHANDTRSVFADLYDLHYAANRNTLL